MGEGARETYGVDPRENKKESAAVFVSFRLTWLKHYRPILLLLLLVAWCSTPVHGMENQSTKHREGVQNIDMRLDRCGVGNAKKCPSHLAEIVAR